MSEELGDVTPGVLHIGEEPNRRPVRDERIPQSWADLLEVADILDVIYIDES